MSSPFLRVTIYIARIVSSIHQGFDSERKKSVLNNLFHVCIFEHGEIPDEIYQSLKLEIFLHILTLHSNSKLWSLNKNLTTTLKALFNKVLFRPI